MHAGADRIEEKKLASALGIPRRRLRLASPSEALRLCGFAIGTIPPLGHAARLPTFVDAAVARQRVVFGGGGHPDVAMRVEVETLVAHSGGRVCDIAAARVPGAPGLRNAQLAGTFPASLRKCSRVVCTLRAVAIQLMCFACALQMQPPAPARQLSALRCLPPGRLAPPRSSCSASLRSAAGWPSFCCSPLWCRRKGCRRRRRRRGRLLT